MTAPNTNLPVLKDARYQDIARRVIQGQDTTQIARAFGLQARQIRRILADPAFALVYDDVKNAIYGGADGADKLIKDEKASISLRKSAAAVRGWTVLGEIMEASRTHIEDAEALHGSKGAAKSATLRVGLEAAVAAIDRADRGMESGREGTKHLHLHLPTEKGTVIKETMAEADVDISDIIGVGVVDAEVIEVEDDEIPTEELQCDDDIPGTSMVKAETLPLPEVRDSVDKVPGTLGDSTEPGEGV